MVLGRGTTVVAHPDGQLGPYFDSIERMRALAASGEVGPIWPAHGPVLADALGTLDYYLVHRRQRLAQVEDALAQLGSPYPTPRTRPCPPGGRDRLPGRRRVALGRRRVVGPRPAGVPGERQRGRRNRTRLNLFSAIALKRAVSRVKPTRSAQSR
jgi:glyoxylase-like metal-dependent hydrolase (beta-lactamase superfamily II)